MPKYLIERRIPGAGALSPDELHKIAGTSNATLDSMRGEGKQVQWLQSYVTEDTIHCVYLASDADTVREHARRGGFPADAVHQVGTMIDPTTGE
ncbi:MAG: DUF4242 domain-containing protein [Dehalococcoidia bacterium]